MGLSVEMPSEDLVGEMIRALKRDWRRKHCLVVPFPVPHVALGKPPFCVVPAVGQESCCASQAKGDMDMAVPGPSLVKSSSAGCTRLSC